MTDQSPGHDAQQRQRIARLREQCGCIHAGVAVAILLVAWPFAAFELVGAGRLTAWSAAAVFVPLAIAISLFVKTAVIVYSRIFANYLERNLDQSRGQSDEYMRGYSTRIQ